MIFHDFKKNKLFLVRTSGAGCKSKSVLMLFDFEKETTLKELSAVPLSLRKPPSIQQSSSLKEILSNVSIDETLSLLANLAHKAWLKDYHPHIENLNLTLSSLAEKANHFSRVYGLEEIPTLKGKLVAMLKLKEVKGIRYQS